MGLICNYLVLLSKKKDGLNNYNYRDSIAAT